MSLNHVRAGEGEALLLVHSLGGSLVMWNPVLELLAAEREVIAVDMPGFGGSSPLPDGADPSAANLANAVIGFYDTLGIEGDPHVAGISLGGWVAIEAARMGRARSAVGLCSAGFWRQPMAPRRWSRTRIAARIAAPLAPVLLRSERVKRAALASQVRHPERLSREEAVSLIREYGRAPAYTRADELMRTNLVGAIDDVPVPLTLAWAEHDTLVRRTPIRAFDGLVRQVVLPDCGHIPTWDNPGLVARTILEATDERAH